jgi:hypothetical protein
MSVSYRRTVPREHVPRELEMLGVLAKPGRAYAVQIFHDTSCPCAGNRAPMPACTCETVNITFGEIQ